MAGIIDGDGCVTLGKNGKFRRPEIVVDSTDHEILTELMAMAGGNISSKKKYKKHHRQSWHWRVHGGNRVLTLLKEIEPYMRCEVKKRRAQLLIAEWRSLTPKNGYYTDTMVGAKLDFEARFMSIGHGRGQASIHLDETRSHL